MKKLTSVVLILLLLFSVPLADAYLGAVISLATVLRVGAIYIAQLWRNEAVRSTVASVLGHVAALTAAYLAYDRGADKPPAERYVTVSLAGVKSKLNEYIASGFLLTADAGGDCSYSDVMCRDYILNASAFDTRTTSYSATSCSTFEASWVQGSFGYVGNCIAFGFTSPNMVKSSTEPSSVACRSRVQSSSVCTPESQADKVISDPIKKSEVIAEIGKAVQAGGTLSSTVPSGAIVYNIGGDVYVSNNYGDANDFISAGSTGSGGGGGLGTGEGITKQEVQDAVSGALTEKLGADPGGITSPSYDNNYENPTENSITDRITLFITSNPIILAIKGSRLLLSGAVCTATIGSAFEKPLTLDFCWIEDYLTMFGNVMVIFAGLTAAFIIFRRGD